jgi:tRNA1Val (adenine37-N6)-methyltransferase
VAEDPLTDDALTGSFRVWQRKRGHRYSLDDLVTAYEAARAAPRAAAYLDLGCGVGSVLLMVASKLPAATLAGIEAQAVSVDLVRRNVARNGVEATLVHGDLRDPAVRAQAGGPFDLITGTPPYFPPSEASPSTDAQRTYARLEMRGGVEAYLDAAAALLAPGGTFVCCVSERAVPRVAPGADAAGLRVRGVRRAIPREGRDPLFRVFTFRHEPGPALEAPPLIARDASGARTEDHHALRDFFGFARPRAEAPSP